MVKKAADGSWNVGVGAAGGLLAQAIAKYYWILVICSAMEQIRIFHILNFTLDER